MQRVLFIFLILMMPISISAKSNNSAKSKEVYGGTLIWGICYKPTIINPLITTHSISMSLLDLIFNRLVRLNSKGEVSPDLAHSWNISGDGLIYTFYLRKGIKFHDGKECTAFDVKFTFEGILDDKNNSPFKSSFDLVKEFKVINPYVFRIILKAPSASFIYRLVQREIVPRHFFEDENSSTTNFNYHPIGTGPFKFKEWTREDRIILEYNPDYYEGRPYLDRIIVKTYEDARGLWFSLMCGAVDFTLFLEREDYEILKDDPSFRAYSFPGDGYYALVYNLNDPVLADNKIRKAIAYGIDKENLTNRAAFGYGLECSAPFSSQSLGFYPDRETFNYNPLKARVLLKDAGWEDKSNNGILEKEGRELELRVLVDTRNDIYKRIIMVIRQQLQEIGIKIKVVAYDDESILSEIFLKRHKPNVELKMLLGGIDPDQSREDWSSYEPCGVDKLWIYKNKKIDELFKLGGMIQKEEERKKIYQEICGLICQDAPVCYLYYPFSFHALSGKFINVDDFFNQNMPFYTIKDWRLNNK